jgi:hypothetical protein
VSGQDHVCPDSLARSFQPGVAPSSGKRLAGGRAQVEAAALERKCKRPRQGPHPLGNSRAVGMNPMIDMSHSQLEPVEILGTDQQVQEHDRVRPPGDGHQGSSRIQTEAGKVAAESLDEGHGLKITYGKQKAPASAAALEKSPRA